VLAQGRKLKRLEHRVTDYDRLVVLLSQNRIVGISRILNVHLRNGASIPIIYDQLQQAINGTYTPRSGWTNREFDVALLVKAYGGPVTYHISSPSIVPFKLLSFVYCSLFLIPCSLPLVPCPLLIVLLSHCPLSLFHCSLFLVPYPLFIVHCPIVLATLSLYIYIPRYL